MQDFAHHPCVQNHVCLLSSLAELSGKSILQIFLPKSEIKFTEAIQQMNLRQLDFFCSGPWQITSSNFPTLPNSPL